MKGITDLQVNKLYNEDCLVGLKKIPDNSVDLVIIDPPYDICTKGGKKGSGRLCHDLTKLENELKEYAGIEEKKYIDCDITDIKYNVEYEFEKNN